MIVPNKSILHIGECMIEMSPMDNTEFRSGFAGDTFNTAWYARRQLSSDWTVGYFTAVGNDRWSDDMIKFFARSGVESKHVVRIPGKSPGLYIVTLANGERSFSYWRSASAARHLMDNRMVLKRALQGQGAVFFSGITLAILTADLRREFLEEIDLAGRAGSLIAFDPNIRPHLWEGNCIMCETIQKAAGVADIVLPSFEDEQAHFGDPSPEATLVRYGANTGKVVIVKNGGGEILASDEATGKVVITPEKVDKPVDTTAAGDAFNAGFLASYLTHGQLKASVEQGASLAGRAICQLGALTA